MNFSIYKKIIPASLMAICFVAQSQVVLRTEHDVKLILSPRDRDLFERLPKEVKAQLLDLVRQSLPLIDSSLKSFVDGLNGAMRDRIDQLGCSAEAALGNVGSSTISGVTGNLPDRLTMAQRIYENREIEFNSKPITLIGTSYGDLLKWIEGVGCNTREPAVLDWVQRMRREVRPKERAWSSLPASCGAPHDCFLARNAYVQRLVASSDSRDVGQSNARSLLASVRTPAKAATSPTDWLNFDRSRYPKWIAFEPELVKLEEIEVVLTTAKTIRIVSARNNLDDAVKRVVDAEALVKKSSLSLSPTDIQKNSEARNDATLATKDKPIIISLNDLAGTQDKALAAEARGVRERMASIESSAASTISRAAINITAIERADEDRRLRSAQAAEAAQARRFDDILNNPKSKSK